MRLWRMMGRGMGCGLLAAGLLSGCSDAPPPPVASHPEVTVPKNQKGSTFDQARSAQNLSYVRQLLQASDTAQAKTYAESAINDWPSSVEAWAQYQAVCRALADKVCQQHADFFHDKVSDMSDLPPRVAVLGLQNLLEDYDPEESTAKPKKDGKERKDDDSSERVDAWSFAMAQRMMAFYDRQDKMTALRDAPVPHLVTDTYPPSTIAGAMIGVGAAGFAVSKFK